MAIVRFDGERVRADPIRKVDAKGWLMKSLQHACRLTVGTEFFVADDDIISMGPIIAQATIGRPDHGLATLEAALLKERETLPTPAQVIRGNPPIAHDAPNKVG